jgi:hypothetical protein
MEFAESDPSLSAISEHVAGWLHPHRRRCPWLTVV